VGNGGKGRSVMMVKEPHNIEMGRKEAKGVVPFRDWREKESSPLGEGI